MCGCPKEAGVAPTPGVWAWRESACKSELFLEKQESTLEEEHLAGFKFPLWLLKMPGSSGPFSER